MNPLDKIIKKKSVCLSKTGVDIHYSLPVNEPLKVNVFIV